MEYVLFSSPLAAMAALYGGIGKTRATSAEWRFSSYFIDLVGKGAEGAMQIRNILS